jgi:hypothetical protein
LRESDLLAQMEAELQQDENSHESDVDDDFNLASHFEDSSSDSTDDDSRVCWEHIDDHVLTRPQVSQDDQTSSSHSPAQQLTTLEARMHFRGFLKHINITAFPFYNPCCSPSRSNLFPHC